MLIRLVLVGCGKIGTAGHLPALKTLQDEGLVQFVACDADRAKAEAAASKFGVPCATDWEAAAENADAVAVCLPPGPNAEVAAAAAERGLHVLCEKPPGRRVEDATRMAVAQAAMPHLVTMIGFNRRFNPLYQRAMERSLDLGPPTSFYGRFSRDGLGSPPDDTALDWILSSSSHALDLAVATMGYPTAVSVSRRAVGPGPDNAWTVQLHTNRGGAVLFLNYAAGRRVERFEWAGPGYDATLDVPKRAEWAQSGRPVELWDAPDDTFHHAFGFTSEYRCFLRAIAGQGPRPSCDFSYAPDFMRLVKTILATEDGAIREVPMAGGAPAEAPTSARGAGPTAPATVRRGAARPVVLMHQPRSVHHRFFSVARMSALTDRCDIRLVDAPGDPSTWKEASAIVTGRGAKALAAGIDEWAPNLELLVVLGASVRNLSAEALLDRGVAVCNTADAVAQIVAEHCLMLALAGLRRLPQTDQAMHRGEWPRPGQPSRSSPGLRSMVRQMSIPAPVRAALKQVDQKAASLRSRPGHGGRPKPTAPPASDLRGEVVGLIGWGHTARRFAELLVPFGCSVLVATESGDPTELEALGARRAALGELLASAKVISLHKGLIESTRGFLGEQHLALIRPGSVLVNIARGGLVDEQALLARLAKGDITAALDVYTEEPLPKDHPLRRLENVILTPHHASTTAQEELRMGDQALEMVLAWADGRSVESLDARRLARMT